jgi:hypothetical protein
MEPPGRSSPIHTFACYCSACYSVWKKRSQWCGSGWLFWMRYRYMRSWIRAVCFEISKYFENIHCAEHKIKGHWHEKCVSNKHMGGYLRHSICAAAPFRIYPIVPLKATIKKKFTFTIWIEMLSFAPHYMVMVADRRSLEKACGTPQITRKTCLSWGGANRKRKIALLLSHPWQPLVKLLSPGEHTGNESKSWATYRVSNLSAVQGNR